MEEKKIKKIAILTSGGDSSGMNAAINAVVRTALSLKIKPYFIYGGYRGLFDGDIREVDYTKLKDCAQRGGTFLFTKRFPEFDQHENRKKAAKILEDHDIDALIVIGGDGSYLGAAHLSRMGTKVMGLPGTIDNDISSTEFTIGFFTSLKAIHDDILRIKDSARSHHQCSIVEVMGRYRGDLALYSAISTSAQVLSIPEAPLTEEEIIEQVKDAQAHGSRSIIVIVTEHQFDVKELSKKVEAATSIKTRPTVLGYLQRGGNTEPMDIVFTSRMARQAVVALSEGRYNKAIGIKNNKVIETDIVEATEVKKPFDKDLYEVFKVIKTQRKEIKEN